MKQLNLSKLLFIGFLSLLLMPVSAQFRYTHGFETSAATENANWVLVSDPTQVNKWNIGPAVRRSGSQSLYISGDNGASITYQADSTVAIAYREFTLPAGATYSISFDWRGKGAATDSLYVCWVDDPTATMQAGPNYSLPTWVHPNLKFQGNGTTLWPNATFLVTGTGAPAKLVFIWKNGLNVDNPPASIDNIIISEAFIPGNYMCDFENPAENATWSILNNAAANTNKWVVGTAEYTSPNHSLYISPDNGASATYLNNSCNVFVVKEITVPSGAVYTVSFDWKAYGEAGVDFLSAHWVTDSTMNFLIPNTTNLVSAYANTTRRGEYQTQLNWQNATFTITGTGRPARLVFMWRNNGSVNGPLSACIDNIQITDESKCPKPSNFVVTTETGGSVSLSWTGSSGLYEIMYRNDYTNSAYTLISGITSSPYTISDLAKGRYTFMVRSICGNDTSAWATSHNTLLIADIGCINFIDLTNTAMVTATTGSYANPFSSTGIVNAGQYSGSSQHTVVTEQALDPRTNNGLKMIPDGELASVRLGNWNNGAQAESLTYRFTVDSVHSVFLMNYAIVFENPNHTEPPEFLMEILNSSGQRINAICGIVNFTTDDASQWNRYNHTWNAATDSPRTSGTGDMMWKNWTKIGYNLTPYIGQTVQVRLVTKDCSASGHAGYAYFTISCAQGKLEGLSCGTEVIDSITAPEGFEYKWFRQDDQNQVAVSTSRWFTPDPTDTNTYVCRNYLIDNRACYFDLVASLKPRWPRALATSRWTPSNCENIVTMVNNSIITTGGGTDSGDRPDVYRWRFSNGQTSTQENPVITFPNDGGTYEATLIAGLSGSECVDSVSFNITLPNIGDNTFERVLASVCGAEDSVIVNHKVYKIPGLYLDTTETFAGCDSIIEITVVNGSSIIEQNWNNVIAVLNDQYNGGYVFTAYQWYKNDLPIEGETKSYIYIPEGLDLTADYKALVTTTNDSVFFTCPIRPQYYSDLQVVPTVIFPRNVIQVNAPVAGTVNVWSITGILVDTHRITAENGQITSPSVPGMYILEITLDSGVKTSVRIVVKKN